MPDGTHAAKSEPRAGFFTAALEARDPEIAGFIAAEARRQGRGIELIASENIVSRAVLEALGSLLTNKTVEGYPGKRYHGGAAQVDKVERAAIERAKRLFGCAHANVQPHSGSQANQAVFLALLRPGDKVLSMSLTAGGHLSHGAGANLSGKWFDVAHYGVRREDGLIDYDELDRLAAQHKPRLVIAGGSAYPRAIDFSRFRTAADRVGAHLMVDMAHFAGLVAAGVHPDPFPHAHIVTTTTTKTLRGARGGLILTDDAALARRIDSAVFPGLQGSVHLQTVAAKAVCLGEALRPDFKAYGERVVANARALAASLIARGFQVCTGGTDTHLVLLDLAAKELTGAAAETRLEAAGLTCNKNPVPGDAANPHLWTGLRLGVAAGTTRGFGPAEFRVIGGLIGDILDGLAARTPADDAVLAAVRDKAAALAADFPIYPETRDQTS